MHRSSRQKFSQDIVELNSTIHQLDVIDIYRLLHPTTEPTFFPSSHGTFSKLITFWAIKHNKFKRIEIMQYLLSDHNGIKLEIKSRKIARKIPTYLKKTSCRLGENLCKRYIFVKDVSGPFNKRYIRGLTWWQSGWESACQCRGHGFEPWSGKIPHATEQLSLCATTTEPAL